MLRSYFEDLRRKKEFEERRYLSIRTIAEETGLSQGAILRVKNMTMERLHLSTVWTLCRYFGVKSLCELIELIPDKQTDATTISLVIPANTTQAKSLKH